MFMNMMLVGVSSVPPAGGAASISEAADVASGAGSSIAPAVGSGAANESADVPSGAGTVTTPLTAAASPSSLSASGFAPITLTTPTATATAAGGTGPYTFAWTYSSVSGGTPTITNPNGATTAFSAHVNAGGEVVGFGICTVHDSLGALATCSVSVAIESTN